MILVRSSFQSMQLNNNNVFKRVSKISLNDLINVISRVSTSLVSLIDSQRLTGQKRTSISCMSE